MGSRRYIFRGLSSRGEASALCLFTRSEGAVLEAGIPASVLHEELSCPTLGGMSHTRACSGYKVLILLDLPCTGKAFAIHRERERARGTGSSSFQVSRGVFTRRRSRELAREAGLSALGFHACWVPEGLCELPCTRACSRGKLGAFGLCLFAACRRAFTSCRAREHAREANSAPLGLVSGAEGPS